MSTITRNDGKRTRHTWCLGFLTTTLILAASLNAAAQLDLTPGYRGLRVDPSGRIWVASFRTDHVLGCYENPDIESQEVLVVPNCGNPQYITIGQGGTHGYTASWDRDRPRDIVVFDLATGEIESVLTDGPDDCHFNAAVAPDESWLYFSNYYGASVTKMSLPGGAVVATVPVGSWPAKAEVTPDGTHLYVIDNHPTAGGSTFKVIDTATDDIAYEGLFPSNGHDIRFSSDGTRAYVTGPNPASRGRSVYHVYVYDTSSPDSPSLMDTIELERSPHGVAVSDSVVAVSLRDPGGICFINVRCDDNSVIGYNDIGGDPWYGDMYGDKVYFADYETAMVHIADVPPCGVVAPYEENFDSDPGWITNNPSNYYVTEGELHGHGVNDSYEYCTVPLSSHHGDFVLEWDSFSDQCDWSSGVAFGLFGCDRRFTWWDPLDPAPQYVHAVYGHNDGGYHVALWLCDDSGSVMETPEQNVGFIDTWLHNTLTFNGSGTVSLAVSVGTDVLANFELTGVSGFDESLCQLGMSMVHDYAVPGQVTNLRVDDVSLASWSATGLDESDGPDSAHGLRSYPNPFNPSTTIAFEVDAAGHVDLSVYDSSGRLVRSLVSGELRSGRHTAVWDGRDDAGRSVASGVYFCKVDTPDSSDERKMVMLK